ncbi:MAG: TlpA family protein disulfide reductase [Planctomycetaceae bacterium]|nr:TlpA family protein disulfide reductase [Planctomycetaceae bacterium]
MRIIPAVLLCLCASGCRDRDPVAKNQLHVPDFRLDAIGHERFYLNDHRGKVVVLAFWATWCQPCKTELLELKTLAADLEDKNVVAAAVCTDPENVSDLKSVVESLEIDYPVLLDSRGDLFKRLGLTAVPTTLVLDPEGNTVLKREGFDPAIMQQIRKSIEQLTK